VPPAPARRTASRALTWVVWELDVGLEGWILGLDITRLLDYLCRRLGTLSRLGRRLPGVLPHVPGNFGDDSFEHGPVPDIYSFRDFAVDQYYPTPVAVPCADIPTR
jgi:hypothetical protein